MRDAPAFDMPSRSDHYDGAHFFNPSGPQLQPFSAVPRMMLERGAPWPAAVPVQPLAPASRGNAPAVITFVGHSTFLIQTERGNVLTDPMYSDRAGPWNIAGPRRVRPPAVRFDDLPRIDVVLLSHNHYDHCDLATLRRLAARWDPLVVTPLDNAPLVRTAGIRRVEELDWWQPSSAAPMSVTVTRAHHFCARTPFDRNRALWGGFVMRAGDRRIYFAGDTAYAPFFDELRQRLGPPDLALIPIGAYEPRWFMQSVHMNPAEAVQAHLELGATRSLAMHFGTFRLTNEAIDEPQRALAAAMGERGIASDAFRVPGFGESVRLD